MIIPFGGDLAWSDLSKDLLEMPKFAYQLLEKGELSTDFHHKTTPA